MSLSRSCWPLIGAIFYVATLTVRTIVPLRVLAIVSTSFFIAHYAVVGAVFNIPWTFIVVADQRCPPRSDADFDQKGTTVSTRRFVDGLTQAVHGPQKVSQGRSAVSQGRCS
jgi:hypothetical protein